MKMNLSSKFEFRYSDLEFFNSLKIKYDYRFVSSALLVFSIR